MRWRRSSGTDEGATMADSEDNPATLATDEQLLNEIENRFMHGFYVVAKQERGSPSEGGATVTRSQWGSRLWAAGAAELLKKTTIEAFERDG